MEDKRGAETREGSHPGEPSPWWGVRDTRGCPLASSRPPYWAPPQVFPTPSPHPIHRPPLRMRQTHHLEHTGSSPKPHQLSEISTIGCINGVLMMAPQHLALTPASLHLLHLFQQHVTGTKGCNEHWGKSQHQVWLLAYSEWGSWSVFDEWPPSLPLSRQGVTGILGVSQLLGKSV